MGLAENDLHLARAIHNRDSSFSSPDSAAFTPESTANFHGDVEEDEEDEGMLADPLLRAGQEEGEVYELREGVGRRKSARPDSRQHHDYEEDGGMEEMREEDGEEDIVYTADEERAIVRKFDRRLVLFVALLYLLSFLDRSSEFLLGCPDFLHHLFFGSWCLNRLILPAYGFCGLHPSTASGNLFLRGPPPPAVALHCDLSRQWKDLELVAS